jgi:phosphohistidine phosphatase
MELYLIRHAIAEKEAPSGEDSLRALSEKGAKKMRQIAKGLRMLGSQFDVILSSPYVRARETAEILADVFKMNKKLEFTDSLAPMADPNLLLAEIDKRHRVNSIALVGHEPYLSRLISILVANGAEMSIALKKGGVCRVLTDDLGAARRATMHWLLTPSVLVEIANG